MEYFGISLLLMVPAGIILLAIVVAYLIYNRIRENRKEDFERRDN
jgi:uncharacterized membrane protein